MIEIKNVSQFYDKKMVLDDIHLTIERHEKCALVGRNGAGKSTLIYTMLGLLPLKKGEILVNGTPIQKKAWKKHVSYLPEKFQLYPHLTGLENIQFFAAVHNEKVDSEKLKEALTSVRLWDDRNEKVMNYSKGMLQRLGLGIMLVYDSDILILDEPTSGLDPIGRIEFLNILNGLKDKTILLSSHHMEEVKQICTHVVYLHDKQITKYSVNDFLEEVAL